MRINNLQIHNFRGIKDLSISLVSTSPQILVGENNAGKSTIVQALGTLISVLKDKKRLEINDWHNHIGVEPLRISISGNFSDQDMSFFRDFLEISPLKFENFKSVIGNDFEISIGGISSQPMDVDIRIGKIFINQTNSMRFERENDKAVKYPFGWRAVSTAINESRDDILKIVKSHGQVRDNLTQFQPDKDVINCIGELLAQSIVIFPEFRARTLKNFQEVKKSPDGFNLASVLFRLKNGNRDERRRFSEIQNQFEIFFPSLHLNIKQNNSLTEIIIEKNASDFNSDYFGSGIFEMINFLTHTTGVKNNFIAIDEPEQHLHPHAKRALRKIINEYGKDNQYLIVTHSSEFVNTDEIYNNMIISQINGETNLLIVGKDSFSDWELRIIQKRFVGEIKEFIFARKVVLVEGATEKIALPILFQGRIDFDLEGISVLSVDSNHFEIFCKVLSIFRIPALVISDSGTQTDINKLQKEYPKILFYTLKKNDFLEIFDANLIVEAKKNGFTKKPDQSFYVSNKIIAEKMELPIEIIDILDAIKKM